MPLTSLGIEALASLLPEGGPLSLDDATLIAQFQHIPIRAPHTAKNAERIQLHGIADVANDLQLRAPLSQRQCLAYSVAVRTRPQIFAALATRRRESCCARFTLRSGDVQIDIDPMHIVLMFADEHCTQRVAPAVELKVLRDRLGFSDKPGFFGPTQYEYFEALFAVTSTVRLIGFVRPSDQPSAAAQHPNHGYVLYGTATIPLLIAAG